MTVKKTTKFVLPNLKYSYDDLEPYMSAEQLKIHHDEHHATYVNKANETILKLENARNKKTVLDMKCELKNLIFNASGHTLHSLFWTNISPSANGAPEGKIKKEIDDNFGTFEQFKKEFENACNVEGSGWVALAFSKMTNGLLLMQIEKHNVNIIPELSLLLVIDLWEHAYYIDYRNKKSEYIESFWNLVDWDEVNMRFDKITS
jgi:superoxide dismutase, Fe-Mn family